MVKNTQAERSWPVGWVGPDGCVDGWGMGPEELEMVGWRIIRNYLGVTQLFGIPNNKSMFVATPLD